jgi:hypothetical protein
MPNAALAALPVTDWLPGSTLPALPGYYEVRNNRSLPACHHWRLVGKNQRYWDGSIWLCWKDGPASVFGRHETHEWRGQRRWVLVRQGRADLPAGGLINPCLVSTRQRGALWTHLPVHARPFKTLRAAERFAARYPRLRLTAVLA